MPVVAALCHFCEQHGPRVVLTTQSIKNNAKNSPIFPSSSFSEIFNDEQVDDETRCMACTSFTDGRGLITHDSVAEVSYISSQAPLNSRVQQLVKNSCLRSLSAEVSGSALKSKHQSKKSPTNTSTLSSSLNDDWLEANADNDSEGVVVFGDDEYGYTLSHTFRLRDFKARGFHRLFSFIVLSMDKFMFTNNYDFYVSALSTIIEQLRKKALNVFHVEQNEIMPTECFKRATSSRLSHLPAHFLIHHLPNLSFLGTSRSLFKITGCPNVFINLHRQMSWVLRTQSRIHVESVMDGILTQDMLVQMENNAGGTKEFQFQTRLVDDNYARVEILKFFAKRVDELRISERLDADILKIFLSHMITGGQVVIKCENAVLTKKLLYGLSYLLPIGCVRQGYSNFYQHMFRYNMHGCPSGAIIPPDADVFSIEIILPNQHSSALYPSLPQAVYSDHCRAEQLDTYYHDGMANEKATNTIEMFELASFKNLCFPPRYMSVQAFPAIVSRYASLLLDDSLTTRTQESVIRNTREVWLNKAKLFYQISRQKKDISLDKVFQIVKCKESDSRLLFFWQTGLSNVYKRHVSNETE